jgi:hypothetical protein
MPHYKNLLRKTVGQTFQDISSSTFTRHFEFRPGDLQQVSKVMVLPVNVLTKICIVTQSPDGRVPRVETASPLSQTQHPWQTRKTLELKSEPSWTFG